MYLLCLTARLYAISSDNITGQMRRRHYYLIFLSGQLNTNYRVSVNESLNTFKYKHYLIITVNGYNLILSAMYLLK